MKIVDANVLLYAVNTDSDHHEAALGWLDRSLSGADQVGLAWVPLLAFLRLVTRPEVFPRPLSPPQAMAQVTDWLSASGAITVHPTPRHPDVLGKLVGSNGAAGNLVNDAHLAALAVEHRASVVTYDRDFARFQEVKSQRPDEL